MPGLVVIRFPDVSGIPQDMTQMGFVFDNDPAASYTQMFTQVENFLLNVPPGGVAAPATYIAASRSRAAAAVQLEAYQLAGHLDGSPHGSPIGLGSTTLPAPGSTGLLPDQLAVVLSYHADFTGVAERGGFHTVASTDQAIDQGAPATHSAKSRPKASKRGRIWFGPLSTFTLGDVEGSGVKAQVLSDLCKAAGELATASAAANVPWSVWSRIGSGAVNHIVAGWCDQRFGTQRRRRDRATERSLWP